MRLSLSDVIERLRSSLWLAPGIALVASIAAGVLSVWLDATRQFTLLRSIITRDPESARAVLSVVSTGMLSFTALVFTITMVVLQLAAAQYSPRITRTFLRDTQTKVTLSIFIATFSFSVVALRSVASDSHALVPALSVGITYALVFASLLAFIGYLHHMARSVSISHMLRRISDQADEVLAHLPEAEELSHDEADWEWRPVTERLAWEGRAGVVTHVSERRLAEAGRRRDVVLRLCFAVGDFVPRGAPLLEVRGPSKGDTSDLCESITVGPDRTPQQDLAMPLRHLVDVALRALSPGVNDPTTAVQAIDQIHDILRRLVQRRLPSPYVCDDEGVLRAVIPRMTWEGYVRLAFTEIRRASGSQVQVCRRLFGMIEDLLTLAPEERQAPLLREQDILRSSVRDCFPLPNDRETAALADTQGLGVHFPPPPSH